MTIIRLILDTNIFARFLVKDDISSHTKAKEILSFIENGKSSGKVSILVIDELIWVLENYYDLPRSVFIPELVKIFSLKGIKIIEAKKAIIMKVFSDMERSTFDFTDLYLREISGGDEIVSFDKDFLKMRK